MAISWPCPSVSRVSMTLANWAGDRLSRFRFSRPLRPYSGSPSFPRRPYFSLVARRRTSPAAFTASWTTWNRSTATRACGRARRTADRNTVHMSMATTSTRSRQAGGAWSSQYAASSAVRPSTCPSMPCSPDRSQKFTVLVGRWRGARLQRVLFRRPPARTAHAVGWAASEVPKWPFSDGLPPNRTCPFSGHLGSPVLIVVAVEGFRRGCPRGMRGRRRGSCGGVLPSAWPIRAGCPSRCG